MPGQADASGNAGGVAVGETETHDVNDRCGYPIGNEVLLLLSRLMHNHFRFHAGTAGSKQIVTCQADRTFYKGA